MSMEAGDFHRLYSRSLEDLYEELGRVTLTPVYREHPPTKQVTVQQGKSFVSSHLEKLKAKICGDWHYCSKRSSYLNLQSLAYAIAPLVSSVAGVPASTAMIVTVLLLRIGLDDLCRCPSA